MKRCCLCGVFLPLLAMGCSITINTTPPVTGSGTAQTQDRDIGQFDRLQVSIPMDVTVTCGKANSLILTTDDNLVPLITTQVIDGTLHLECVDNIRPRATSSVHITVPNLQSVAIRGSGDVRVEGMSPTDAAFSIEGSGSISGDVNADRTDISVAGTGSVSLTGQAALTEVSVAGSGEVNLTDLASDDVSVSIAGSGDVAVHALRTLDVSIAGSGNVTYRGNPTVTKSVMGSGDISQLP